MDVLHNFAVEIKDNGAAPSSRRLRLNHQPATGPLFDARFRRHVAHLCNLGPRPVGEFLQLVGTKDDARTALIVLLGRYGQLNADLVEALGGDRWPETTFRVGPA